MRVVLLSHSSEVGGAELSMLDLASALKSDGRIDPVIFLLAPGPLEDRTAALGITTEVVPMHERTRTVTRGSVLRNATWSTVDVVSSARRLARRLTAQRADALHTNSLKAHVV